MAWYRTGTVGVTNGATAVTLSGGDALANIFPGDTFKGPDGRAYEIASITSASAFTLAKPYQGPTASGQPYAIQPTAQSGAIRLMLDQVSDLVTHYQQGRDSWTAAASGTIKGRKSAGAGLVEDLNPADVLTLLTGGNAAAALTGGETLPLRQGTAAVRATANQLLSRAAGQVVPFEIGGQRIATVTASGIGIGRTAPAYAVDVLGSYSLARFSTDQPNGAERVGVLITGNGGASDAARVVNIILDPNGADGGGVDYGILRRYGDGELQLSNSGSNPITLHVGGFEGARLDHDRNFLVATRNGSVLVSRSEPGIVLSNSGILYIAQPSSPSSANLYLQRNTGVVAQFRHHPGTGNAVTVGSISITSSSTAYNTTSDYRLKDGFTEIDDASAIDRVKQLRPGRFAWKSTGEWVDGFLAHEAQAVVPEAVTGEKDQIEEIGDAVGYREHDPETGVPILGTQETLTGITQAECPEGYTWTKTGERPVYQGIDQSKLVPLLAAGLKAAIGEIEALKARVAALESAG